MLAGTLSELAAPHRGQLQHQQSSARGLRESNAGGVKMRSSFDCPANCPRSDQWSRVQSGPSPAHTPAQGDPMHRIGKRTHILASAALAVCVCVLQHHAVAQIPLIPVYDGTRWLQMFEMLKDVRRMTGQVQSALTQVQNAARGLGGGNIVEDILIAHRNLTGDLDAISYRMDTVSAQFRQVFPDREAARNVAPDDAQRLRAGWDREIQQSGLAATRAQTSLARLEQNSRSAAEILERSKTAVDGDEGSRLAKLQALNQMLGVINSDLTALSTTIAASQRVNSDVAAAQVSDESLEAARAERMRRDYTRDEPLPDVQLEILR